MMVVEDRPVRDDTISVIDRTADMDVIAVVGSAKGALSLLDVKAPDVVVIDQYSGTDSATTCAEIIGRRPSCAVVILTAAPDDGVLHACLAAGARGFLLRSADGAEVIRAIRVAANGRTTLGPEFVETVVRWAREARTVCGEGETLLGPKEMLALALAGQGKTNRAIARHMGVSEPTAKRYLHAATRKLGVSGRSAAVAVGIRMGVI